VIFRAEPGEDRDYPVLYAHQNAAGVLAIGAYARRLDSKVRHLVVAFRAVQGAREIGVIACSPPDLPPMCFPAESPFGIQKSAPSMRRMLTQGRVDFQYKVKLSRVRPHLDRAIWNHVSLRAKRRAVAERICDRRVVPFRFIIVG
jgi:hypothetical protein